MSNKFVYLIQPVTSFKLAQGDPALYDQFDSIGLLSLAGYLESKGYTVEILHLARAFRYGYTRKQVIDKIKSRKPLLVAVQNMWLHQSVGMLEITSMIRQIFDDVPVVTGGQHASFFARDIVNGYSDLLDGVIVGEGEETLLELIRSIEDTGKIDDTITGFMSKDKFGNIHYVPREVKLLLDDLPLLSYRYCWPKITPRSGDIAPLTGVIDTVRGGCPQRCTHCLESNDLGKMGRCKRQFHSPEYLADQFKLFYKEGKRTIAIQDSFYANGDGPIVEFVDRVLKQNVTVDAMHFFIEPGYCSSNIFKELARFPAKKVAIDYGIETGSKKVAQNMKRFDNYDRIYEDVEALGKTNTLCTAWWLISLPGETEEDVRYTEKAIKKTIEMGVFAERVSQMLLFPQTELYKNRDKYQMKALFHTYEDFKIFSTIERRANGLYPELVTHEMPYQTREDTIQLLKDLKKTAREATQGSKFLDKMVKLGFQFNEDDFF